MEIQQIAKRQEISPTGQLLTQWSQLNHKVEELFMLLYRMKYITALRCLKPVVDKPFHRLLQKHDSKTLKERHSLSYDVDVKFHRNIFILWIYLCRMLPLLYLIMVELMDNNNNNN
ncbi:jg17238, partial [Pararge aegeria aegeria]